MSVVKGRSRVPFPPARITALMVGLYVVEPRLVPGEILRLPEPVDGFPQPRGKVVPGAPAGERRHLAVVPEKPRHFGLVGAQPLGLRDDARVGIELRDEQVYDVPDRMLGSARD